MFFQGIFVISRAQIQYTHYNATPQGSGHIDSLLQVQKNNASGPTKVIVEFAEEPMFIARAHSSGLNKVASAAVFMSRFSQFSSDLSSIRASFTTALSTQIAIDHQFYKTFFGVGVTVPGDMLPAIERLPYVKAIHYDHEVHATTDPSIYLIDADKVWIVGGTQGENARIGIIDSGIDYMHPALGGGFGPGFKVAGGYDFVNHDADPMDDLGHGTHVAGIVSANGDTVKGVAPKAILYAYKVLGSNGSGSESDIIEAVERTVDPNQDNDPSDRLDVVNMSLGSNNGSPYDASSIAVNNATKLGVVFCIAAGNSGGRTPVEGKEDNYFYDGSGTIGSPGTADLAITVGASDNSDHLAIFSSRGPNRGTFSIKPDVLAPGVNITSTYLSSGFATLNGTSMATPMVTGVAALVKSVHPDWTPAQIKSAVVNTAKDIGVGGFKQGGGRVRALNAVLNGTLVVPSTLSFGVDDPSAGTWTKPETLFVYNKRGVAQTYSAGVGVTPPGGISITVSPSSFSIAAHDSAMVVATLSVNNSQIVTQEEDILRYTGSVALKGTNDTVHAPWGFVRTSRLAITLSEPNAFFIGISPQEAFLSTGPQAAWLSPTRAEIYSPLKGTYEFFTLFRNPAGSSKIVIKEGISVNGDDVSLSINSGEAVYPLVYHGLDQAGTALSTYRAPRRLLTASLPNFGDLTSAFLGGSDTLLLSAASGVHTFTPIELEVDLTEKKTFHTVQYNSFKGMSGPVTLTNSPSIFIPQHFAVKVPPGTTQAAGVLEFYRYAESNGQAQLSPLVFDIDTVAVTGDQYSFTGYFGKSPDPAHDLAAVFYNSYSDMQHLPVDLQTNTIMPYKDSIMAFARANVSPATPRFESGATMTFGGAPVLLSMQWYNNMFGTSTLHFRTLFMGMLREFRSDELHGTYTLYDHSGAKLFTHGLSEFRQPLQLPNGRYTMVVSMDNYWLRNAKGLLSLTSEFDLTDLLPAPVPPSITSFMLLDEKKHTTESFTKGQKGTLLFSVGVANFLNNGIPVVDLTKAWFRQHGTTPWKSLLLSRVPGLFDEGLIMQADLGSATAVDSTAVDIRISSTDSTGATVDQVVAPAFAVGNWQGSTTDVKDLTLGKVPDHFALEQNYPNPFNPSTAISYQLTVNSEVTLKVFDVLGREVATLVNEKKDAGSYSVRFSGAGLSSGVYLYRLQAGEFTQTRKLMLLK